MKGTLALAAALAFAAGAMPGSGLLDKGLRAAAVAPVENRLRQVGGGGRWGRSRSAKRGPGWSPLKVQRMARKRRNQLRHRAACKGSR